ncbi:MAG: hypothetical protein HS111_06635 [Kofleriaceae bacterium]|nr:hypothetical protein [Kofleriaceae bacterium]MCL4223823.1 hypothetical protein [Myxococcales bacterium]
MRLAHYLAAAATTFALVACGGDDGDNPSVDAANMLPNPGFPVPTAPTKANERQGGVWTELGPANWSCLNTASTDQPSTQTISMSGLIEDFQTGAGVGAAAITAFPGIDLNGNSGTATSDNNAQTRGEYTISLAQLPSGTTRYGFKFEAASYVKTYLLNQYVDPATATQTRDMAAVSEATALALPAFIGVTRDVTKGVLAGAFRDCDGNEVSNAVATVSSTSGTVTHLDGAKTFYFSAGSSSLPVRHTVSPVMNKDGLFVVLDLPPQTGAAYVQIWGFVDDADLADGQMTLLSELASPVEANAVITGSFEPKRSN